MTRWKFPLLALSLAALVFTGMAFAQTDPGVQAGNRGTGRAFASVTANTNDNAFFQAGLGQFNETQTVTGDNPGLGPRFNSNSCGNCHAQPAAGGTGAAVNPQFQFTNPQIPANQRVA